MNTEHPPLAPNCIVQWSEDFQDLIATTHASTIKAKFDCDRKIIAALEEVAWRKEVERVMNSSLGIQIRNAAVENANKNALAWRQWGEK